MDPIEPRRRQWRSTSPARVALLLCAAAALAALIAPAARSLGAGPAVGDTVGAVEDEVRTIPVAELLDNDDLDGASLLRLTQPSHGFVYYDQLFDAVMYLPHADFHGTDSFDYVIGNGETSATASVEVVVSPVQDRPSAANDVLAGTEDTSLEFSTVDLFGNDTDIDGDELLLASFSQPFAGTLSLAADARHLTYEPDPDHSGTDTFIYTVSDGINDDSALVTIHIAPTQDPVIAVDDTVSVHIDTETALPLTANDSVADGLASVVIQPAAHGTISSLGPNQYTYTPDPGATGEFDLAYTVTDVDGDSATGTIRLLVGFADIVVASTPQLDDQRSLYTASVSGDAWLLAEPSWTETWLDSVSFRLDGLPFGTTATEAPFAPFVDAGLVAPIDTTSLANGVHTLTATFSTDAGLTHDYLLPFFVTNP